MDAEFWASPVWVAVGIFLAVLSIVIGIFFAWWFARGSGLSFQVSGTTLISAPANERIAIIYDGLQVEQVTQSIVWLWRTGRGVVNGSDVVESDPVVVHVPDGSTILDVKVLRQSRPTNDARTRLLTEPDSIESKRFRIDFEYFDRRQGVAIEVFHTAPRPDALRISGTIKGIPRGIRTWPSGSNMQVRVGLIGSAAITIPTSLVPGHLRGVTRPTRSPRETLIEIARAVGRSLP